MKNNVMDMISITDSPLFHPDSPKIGEEDSHDGKWKLPDFSDGPPSDFWFAWILCCGMHCGFALYWVCSGAGELRIWVAPRYCPRHPLAPLVTSLALRVWMHCVCVLRAASLLACASPPHRAAACPLDWNCALWRTAPPLVARGSAALLTVIRARVCAACACCVVPPLALLGWNCTLWCTGHHRSSSGGVCGSVALLTGIWARVCVARVASCRLLPYGLELRYIIHRPSPRGTWLGGAAMHCILESGRVCALRILRRAASMDWTCTTSSTGPCRVVRGSEALLTGWNLGTCRLVARVASHRRLVELQCIAHRPSTLGCTCGIHHCTRCATSLGPIALLMADVAEDIFGPDF